jgi:hypothetical protein
MINIVKLTFILVVWSLVILFLTSKKKSNYEEFFNETTTTLSAGSNGTSTDLVLNFTPWGKTELGCVNRCKMYTINNFDYSDNLKKEDLEKECKKICSNCTSTRCGWYTGDLKLTIRKKTKTNFNIEYIGGDTDILIKWKYYINNDLYSIERDEYEEKEPFCLTNSNQTVYTFEYKSSNDIEWFESSSNDSTIYYIIGKLDKNTKNKKWFMIDSTNIKVTSENLAESLKSIEENTIYLCSNNIHPLNKSWKKTLQSKSIFTSFKKLEDAHFEFKVINFVIQLIDANNESNGIQIYNYIDDFEKESNELHTSKIFKKRITNLERNNDYKLSIYPIILKINIEDNTQEKITSRNSGDISDTVFVHTNDSTVINL